MRALVVIALVACALSARADDAPKQRARQLLAQGNALYATGDFRGALALFRQAYDFFPSGKLLVNTAACEHAIGRNDRAASDLAQFLRTDDASDLATRARADLDAYSSKLGRIVVVSASADATIEVDGETSWSIAYVTPGEHLVVLREEGRPSLEEKVRIEIGRSVEVRRPEVVVDVPRPPEKRRRAWVMPVVVASVVVVVGVSLGIGLGLGLHHDDALTGNLGTVTFKSP